MKLVVSKIMVDITHPAHFHFFRPAMEIWQQRGYELIIVARAKDVTLQLLDSYGYEYTVLSRARTGQVGLFFELMEHETRLWRLIRHLRPSVILEIAGTFIVHAAALTGTPALVFSDTEHARLSNAITYPFATQVITPVAYRGDVGRKHVRYNGYQELAYLHPNYFQPDGRVRDELGLEQEEPYFIVRFVSWRASHDRGHAGFSLEGKRELVQQLSRLGRVIITSEAVLPAEFESYRMNVSPAKIHDLLAFSSLYVGEGGTMASEAAILGIPSIFVSTLTAGTFQELEKTYELMLATSDENKAIEQALQWCRSSGIRQEWQARRQKLLQDKIDVTAWMVNFIEDYLGDTEL